MRLNGPWKGADDNLIDKCLNDFYPWQERPKNVKRAKELMVQKFHEQYAKTGQ